jgi:pyruvate/2-oxoglutarate/acetoin dehydrogenase E1 component
MVPQNRDMNNTVSVNKLISSLTFEMMKENDDLVVLGLGVSDPKRVFGTTENLIEAFGDERVIETPTSENAMTGVAIGLGIAGYKVLAVHQRLDFFLLAMDQLVNTAAKWNFMYNDEAPMNLTFRLIVGRGWGQGPTHSQNLSSWFAHIPGLIVVALSRGSEVKELLRAAINEPHPVVVIEDRWIHHQEIYPEIYSEPIKIGKAKVVIEGSDLTVVTYGYFVLECLAATEVLNQLGLSIELLDMRTIKPMDYEAIFTSLEKTHNLAVIEPTNGIASIGTDIISKVVTNMFEHLDSSPIHISYPDVPEPTSHGVIDKFIPNALSIANHIAKKFGLSLNAMQISSLQAIHPDVPNIQFKGPF